MDREFSNLLPLLHVYRSESFDRQRPLSRLLQWRLLPHVDIDPGD